MKMSQGNEKSFPARNFLKFAALGSGDECQILSSVSSKKKAFHFSNKGSEGMRNGMAKAENNKDCSVVLPMRKLARE